MRFRHYYLTSLLRPLKASTMGVSARNYSKLTNVPHSLPESLQKDQLLEFPAYRSWITNLEKSLDLQNRSNHPFHDDPYELQKVEVQSCDYFGGRRLGFVKLRAEIVNEKGEKLPGIVFLRGGSTAILIVLRSKDSADSNDEHVIMTVQPRIAAGSMSFVELPAGMIDDSGTFQGAAAKEIEEETGLTVHENDFIDMTRLALENRSEEHGSDESHLEKAVYPSPGGCDEFIPIFLVRKAVTKEELENLNGKLTGLRQHGEKITLKICRLADLWKVGARDGKTLAAIALYEGLKREGRL